MGSILLCCPVRCKTLPTFAIHFTKMGLPKSTIANSPDFPNPHENRHFATARFSIVFHPKPLPFLFGVHSGSASPEDAGGADGADDKGGEAISSNLRGRGSVQGRQESKSAALAQWLREGTSSFGRYTMGDVLA
jgi:hypothetical protein